MPKSKRLRLREIRSLYQLLGECCELGADPIAWRRHVAERSIALFGGQMGFWVEVKVVATPFREPFWLSPYFGADFGWPTPSDRKPFEAHLQSGRPEDGPHITPDLLQRKLKVMHWMDDPNKLPWRRSMFFNEYVKPSHLDDGIVAHHLLEPGRVRWLTVNRALGDVPFGARERRLMRLLNLELAGLLGNRLARIDGPTVSDLPPRQRDVLVCLMEGDSETQASKRLGISRHTVHDYVKMLHERFGVRSRGALLARCRAFWPVLEVEARRTQGAGITRR